MCAIVRGGPGPVTGTQASCLPPSPHVAGLAAWKAGECVHSPTRSPHGCCQSPAYTASSPGRRRQGHSFVSEWWSSRHLKSPCHRTPGAERMLWSRPAEAGSMSRRAPAHLPSVPTEPVDVHTLWSRWLTGRLGVSRGRFKLTMRASAHRV